MLRRTTTLAGPSQEQGSVMVTSGAVRRLLGHNDDINLAAEDLAESLGRLNESTRATAGAAEQASAATTQVDAEATSVASAVQQMSAVMQEVARSATEAATVAAEASQVTGTVESAVTRLMSSSTEIGGVLKTVTGISDQTRMLALNATIEAARAGAAGRGFSVVAAEVKDLAAQTSDATGQIGQQLAVLTADCLAVGESVARIGAVLARVEDLQATIASAVEEQTAAIGEITRSASSTAQAASEMSRSVAASADAARVAGEAMARSREWLERLSTVVQASQTEVAGIGADVEVHPLRKAIAAHAAWKKRLREAIDTGRRPEGVDLATAGRDDVCAFGTWLHSGEAARLDAARTATVTKQHATFHRSAGAVLSAAVSGRREEATALMGASDGYTGAASALTDSLVGWVRLVEGP
ncbi:methyl-accepting chemotaxis protein [Actinotalea sp. K2]|uniref:methyl-accepting chemotaxis protein n=1 Tax=Actinotalea sp. K2 TaxID=2939438 RepID=UPI002016CA85|nr:methyl-accepting chemotaxis protein [Actinotalea sp. K2]MCL3860830.1 methyl-accepting chemotaxis protein [Actinotalea sp. K2]